MIGVLADDNCLDCVERGVSRPIQYCISYNSIAMMEVKLGKGPGIGEDETNQE